MGDVAAGVSPIGLPGGLRLTTTGDFFCLRLDLRFLAIGFVLILFVASKVTRILPDRPINSYREALIIFS